MRVAAPLSFLLALAPLAAPQSSEDDLASRRIADDIDYAEGLARYRYFDLADGLLTDIQSRDLDADNEANIVFTKARITKRASELTGDPNRRLQRQDEAIALLEDWAKDGSPYAFHDRRPDALEDLATLLQARGLLRAELGQPAGDSVDDFSAADDVLERLQAEHEDLAEFAEANDEQDKADRHREQAVLTYYRRGINYIDWSTVASDAALMLDRAVESLQEFLWEVEPDKLVAYFAMLHEARAYRLLGQYEDSIGLLEDTKDQAGWFWDNLEQFDAGGRALITELFDQLWGALALAHLANDDFASAQDAIGEMQQAHEDKDVAYGRAGFTVLLDWADELAGNGRGGPSLEIVKVVAEQARGYPEADRAERMLTDILSEASPSDASAGVMMAAARGFREKQDYGRAALHYGKAAAAVADERERREFGYDAWLGMGRALSEQKRHLEAAAAFENALELELELRNDPERVQSAAVNMYNAFTRRARETGHAFDDQLQKNASSRLLQLGIEENLQFNAAREIFDAAATSAAAAQDADDDAALARAHAEFERARGEFDAVGRDSPAWERAQVYAARSVAGAGDPGQAIEMLDAFLEYTKDPAFAPTNRETRARREAALAQALYYKAQLQLYDLQDRAGALETLDGFEAKVENQVSFHESAQYLRVRAYAELGDVDAAADTLDLLETTFPDSTLLDRAWYDLALALDERAEAARAAGEMAAADEYRGRAADAMWRHCELAGFSSFRNMSSAGDWALAAGQPADAERAYAKVIDVFGRSASVSVPQLDQVRIGLATAYSEQQDYGRARPLWLDLLTRQESRSVLRGAALCFGGWLERDDSGGIREDPGSGDYDEAFDLWQTLYRTAKVVDPQGRDWWEAKLGTIYTLYRQAGQDSQKLKDARSLLENLKLLYPEYDETTMSSLPEENRYSPTFRDLFRYLDRQIDA